MDYYNQKAKKMYELYLKGQPSRKVYAAVRKDNEFVVVKNAEGKKWKYQLAGGGVEDEETNEGAIKREIVEELNINADIVKSLGVVNYKTTWTYEGKEFSINNEAEVFLLEFVSFANNNKFGLDGEFSEKDVKGIALISKEEMCSNVYEFASCEVEFSE